jgi:hypothetical protein
MPEAYMVVWKITASPAMISTVLRFGICAA